MTSFQAITYSPFIITFILQPTQYKFFSSNSSFNLGISQPKQTWQEIWISYFPICAAAR